MNMGTPYYKTSSITGRRYDIFSIVRILNIKQVCFYLEQGVPLEDMEVSKDRTNNNPVLVFYFDRETSKDAYDKWCNNSTVQKGTIS